MVSAKKAAQQVLEKLPDDVTFEEIQYRLYVRGKIETGLVDGDAGNLIDDAELERRVTQWRTK